ncbi:unnamed protein product [Diatraea saccharalis]|uniref:Carboxylic ester hydrolase n=1 Tax=Diatraea saccharalis TaxID=40085 RepID=A0A9N9WEL5_9NEOP|nr:unnamed protein product [Diatraea saccharalis]
MWRHVCFMFIAARVAYSNTILVNTPVGLIRGAKALDGEYYTFFGIPYGSVNRTNLFGAPEKYPKFDYIFEAVNDSAICAQIQDNIIQGTSDCLQLNIFVPISANIDHRLPVMVHIHGGYFIFGSKSSEIYGPKYLVRHDVILVVINYRLGPYGFMCLDIPEVPGNQGLKDQVLALRWIKQNIESFGGDATKITVFGVSAGGHSIEFHMLSDNEILFNNAILQSGSAEAATVFTDHDKIAPIRIAKRLGLSTNSLTKAITYLSSLDTNKVIQASNDLSITFKPCVEKKFKGVTPFLTRHWVNADIPKVKDISILLGFCENELLLQNINSSISEFPALIRNRLRNTFNFDYRNLIRAQKVIQNYYLRNKNVNTDLPIAAYFDSDFTYIHPIQRSIKKFLKSKPKSLFYYMFSYNGTRNFRKNAEKIKIGSAVHADEIGYLFDVESLVEEQNPEDMLVLDRMTTMWTNFAKYGDPTPYTSDLLDVKWTQLSNKRYTYLNINSTSTIGQRPAADRMTFWDLFYINNKKYQKGYHDD